MGWMGEKRNVLWLLGVKHEGSRPFGRPRYRWMILLKCVMKDGRAWTVLMWLRTRTSNRLL
jgi:hypothetical protein